jgi:hypothetical protein
MTKNLLIILFLFLPFLTGLSVSSQAPTQVTIRQRYNVKSPTYDSVLTNNDAVLDNYLIFDPAATINKKVLNLDDGDTTFDIYVSNEESNADGMMLDIFVPQGLTIKLLTPQNEFFEKITDTKYKIIGVKNNKFLVLSFGVSYDVSSPINEEITYRLDPVNVNDSNLGNNAGRILITNIPKPKVTPIPTTDKPVITIGLPVITIGKPIITPNTPQSPTAEPEPILQFKEIPVEELFLFLPRTGGLSIIPFSISLIIVLLAIIQIKNLTQKN